MDKLLPSEILIKIFINLPVDDIFAVSDTCTHWKYIVENCNIWKVHWLKLLKITRKTNFEDSSYLNLTDLNVNNSNLKYSCLRLKNILYNKQNQLRNCLINTTAKTFEYAILKTHYNQVVLTLFKYNLYIQRNSYFNYIIKNNDTPPDCSSYVLFRSLPQILENINAVFENQGHKHIQKLVYVYPLGVSDYMEDVIQRLLEDQHVAEVFLIPRVLVVCTNLTIEDAVVVYSTSRSTEVALISRGLVISNRWIEIPVGGWQVAQNLHSTFTWLHPDANCDPRQFDEPRTKALCWLRMPHAINSMQQHDKHCDRNKDSDDYFELKDEQYLAPELMYVELDLCAVIARLASGLEDEQLARCLRHILLVGGNCQLRNFSMRVLLELMKLWPQHAANITISVHQGAPLAYAPPRWLFDAPPPAYSTFVPGQTCRITRELYVRNSHT